MTKDPAAEKKPARRILRPTSQDRVFVGTSGWAYASWKPDFYPQKLPARRFLEHYATRLNSVEVNYTFRALPTPAMLENWLAATGQDFRFSFKAPQRITHLKRLKECGELAKTFFTALQPVQRVGRLGVVLFQLPPNFKADIPRLEGFLEEAGRSNLRLAWEFRHESWFNEEVYGVLRHFDSALCQAESDDLRTPPIQTASFDCYRLRRSDYSEAELKQQADTLCSAERDAFVYFKHEDQPTGALRAERFRKWMKGRK